MDTQIKVDLHMHSTASDGTYTPRGVAEACKEAEITYAALTDHDTVAGVESFLMEAKNRGLHVITGVEFSAIWDGELHLLAYGVDITNEEFLSTLINLANRRLNRTAEMVARLNKNNINIALEDVTRYAKGEVIGRPHVAQALVSAGYASSVNDAFVRYLVEGTATFVPRFSLTKEEIMHITKVAGGVNVFAHPKLTNTEDYDRLLSELKSLGLQGVEAYYPLHTDAECAYFHTLAKKHGLFVTQGSDFHGDMREETFVGKETRGVNFMAEAIEILFS